MKVEKEAYRIPEFGAAYGPGRTKTHELIASGQLRAFKCGKMTLISRAAAEEWRQRCEQEAAEKLARKHSRRTKTAVLAES
jgi:arginine decarboxylase-like protein